MAGGSIHGVPVGGAASAAGTDLVPYAAMGGSTRLPSPYGVGGADLAPALAMISGSSRLTSVSRIKARIETSRHLDRWKRKVHKLRLLVAGDFSPIDDESAPQMADSPDRENSVDRRPIAGLYDAMVQDFEEGTSNKIQQQIRTLLLQSSFRFPEIEFEDATPHESALNALYLKKRMGARPSGCEAPHHMRMALLDYMIGGIGWIWCGVDDGRPVARFTDSLDVAWDLDAKLLTDIRWVAVWHTQTLGDWIELFGEEPFEQELAGAAQRKDDTHLDRLVQLVFYFDVDGLYGTHAVFRAEGHGVVGEPIEHVDNPHYLQVDGGERPFLPLDPMYFLDLPSIRNPIGIVEGMVPHAIAMREAERRMRRDVSSGGGWVEVVEGAYEEDQLETIQAGDGSKVITRNADTETARRVDPADIQTGVMEWWQRNDQALTGTGGADPYSSGDKVEGIQYASEVQAIQASAGLVPASIASDHGAHYERVSQKMLANGQNYDGHRLTLVYDGTPLEFGPGRPIGDYIRPDADVTIAEDNLQFQSKEKRMAIAERKLSVALQVRDLAPNSVRVVYEEYLRDSGERDVGRHFEIPAEMAATMGGLPGAEGPDAEASAEASTR